MIETEIEVFRADTKASRGITADMIADLATGYDGSNPVACCIGHPKNDSPALGEVAAFRADGNKLFATIRNVKAALVDGIKDGSILNRSMAFFSPDHEANPTPGKLAPRHLGFLGASAPGIPGMTKLSKALSFAADGETLEIDGDPAAALLFEPKPTEIFTAHDDKEPVNMDPATKTEADLQADRDALAADRLAFAAEQRTARESSNATLVDGLVASGKLLPANAEDMKTVFNAIDPAPLEFSAKDGAKSPVAALAAILSTGVKLVPVDEGRQSPTGEFNADDKPKDADAITAAARAAITANPSLSFEAAVELVTKGK